jgi:hypothetical protein
MIELLHNLSVLAHVQAVETNGQVSGLLEGIDADKRFVLLIISIGCATGIILGTFGILSSVFSSVHRRRTEIDLKRDMIERGMSADEIAKVIEAEMPLEDATQRWIASWAKKKSG